MPRAFISLFFLVVVKGLAVGQTTPASSSQASAYAASSIAAMTGGSSISDVTLTGAVTWTVGSDTETGTATLQALGTGESRVNLSLSSGTRGEIRDAQTGTTLGKWILPNGSSGKFAFYNCQTDAVWFFPALGSLASGPNVVLSYIGQENRNGESVQHLRSFVNPPSASPFNLQQLSTMDFYLDASTLLPSAIVFNSHPDNNALGNLIVEIDLSNYQPVNGALVPMHIQKYLQGTLMVDLTITNVALNTGLTLSNFVIN